MGSNRIRLAPDLTLPLEIVGEANAVIGKRNSGKTTTAKKLVEEMLRLKQQVIVCEPTDVWWGLRSSADGGPGFPIAVFGGPHGVLPLEPGAGRFMADMLIGEGLSAVLCLKPFSKTARRTFMADFAERLLEIVDQLVHVVLEEAHEWIPQRSSGETARMLGACSDLTTTGRTSGIGTTLVSQRPARIHKDPYEQTDNLIVHQLVGTNDRDAAAGWVKAQDLSDEARDMLDALPKLKPGTAYIYAPALLGEPRFMEVIKPDTFDSQATPKPGERRREPKTSADIDLDAVSAAMSEAIERQKADDPKELRRQLADVRRKHDELAELYKATVEAHEAIAAAPAEVLVPVINDDTAEKLRAGMDEIRDATDVLRGVADNIAAAFERTRQLIAKGDDEVAKARATRPTERIDRPATGSRVAVKHAHHVASPVPAGEGVGAARSVTGSDQRVLNALAWFESIGIRPATKQQVAMLARYKVTGGRFSNVLGDVRKRGLIHSPAQGLWELTEEGRAIADVPATPLTTFELQSAVVSILSESQRLVFLPLLEVWPRAMTKHELAEASGYDPGGGRFGNLVGEIVKLGIAVRPHAGAIAAADVMFIERAR